MSLTIHVFNPKATELSNAGVGDHADGTFADGTYSFLIVNWYTSNEADIDNAGYLKTCPSEWEGVVVSGKNDTGVVTLDLTVATNSISKNRYPDHYTVYCQSGASWTYGADCTKAGEIASNLTATTLYETGTAGPTISAEYSSATVGTVLRTSHELREQHVKTFDGSVVRRSWAHINPLNSFSFVFPTMGLVPVANGRALMGDILKWIAYGTSIKVTDDADNAFIEHYYGILTHSNYLNTRYNAPGLEIELKLAVETCGMKG